MSDTTTGCRFLDKRLKELHIFRYNAYDPRGIPVCTEECPYDECNLDFDGRKKDEIRELAEF